MEHKLNLIKFGLFYVQYIWYLKSILPLTKKLEVVWRMVQKQDLIKIATFKKKLLAEIVLNLILFSPIMMINWHGLS